jgi:hypothetical protein
MQLHAVPCSISRFESHFSCCSMQFHAVPCSSMQLHAAPCSMKMLRSCFSCCFMQFHAVSCSFMQFHAVPCYSPKSHLKHEYLSKFAQSVWKENSAEHALSRKNMNIPRVPDACSQYARNQSNSNRLRIKNSHSLRVLSHLHRVLDFAR